jgi:hypothetical protein
MIPLPTVLRNDTSPRGPIECCQCEDFAVGIYDRIWRHPAAQRQTEDLRMPLCEQHRAELDSGEHQLVQIATAKEAPMLTAGGVCWCPLGRDQLGPELHWCPTHWWRTPGHVFGNTMLIRFTHSAISKGIEND